MSARRREFLGAVLGGTGAAAIGSAFGQLSGRLLASDVIRRSNPLGPLRPVADESTGLELLKLPEGFHYCSFGWTNEPMANGKPTPGAHDGMAVIWEDEHEIVLCRNHEIGTPGLPIDDASRSYDVGAAGGCTNLRFDRQQGKFISAVPSLSGTVKNCAGGATPWGTWLSCEETVVDHSTPFDDGVENSLTKAHGFVFEVPVEGQAKPEPIECLGRFVHEAVAVDPASGIIYLTEDANTAGLYRMIPKQPGQLLAGGKLEMLSVKQTRDVRKGVRRDTVLDVSWVPISDPLRPHSPGTRDGLGVYSQGIAGGGLTFARLEGVAAHDRKIFVTATSGGDAEAGQVWEYDPNLEQLKLLFESPGSKILDMPDNMCVSPRGGIVLCEDGDYVPQRLQVLTTEGVLFPFAANNTTLDGLHGHSGNFRGSEMAGATFSADGEWLFVNMQTPGVTFAITGPWQAGIV